MLMMSIVSRLTSTITLFGFPALVYIAIWMRDRKNNKKFPQDDKDPVLRRSTIKLKAKLGIKT